MPKFREIVEPDNDDIEDIENSFHSRRITIEERDSIIRKYNRKFMISEEIDEFVRKHCTEHSSKILKTETRRESKAEKDEISSQTEFERIKRNNQEYGGTTEESEKLFEECNAELRVREHLWSPKETYKELLNEVVGISLSEISDRSSISDIQIEKKMELGDWSSIGPVFMNEQMRRIHGIIERGYASDDAGASSRGWANQELITTLFEILGASNSINSNIYNLSEGMRKLKYSDFNPERVFMENRILIHSDILQVSNQHQKSVLVSPWWVEQEGCEIPLSLPKLLSFGRFADPSESLYEIGTGKLTERKIAQNMDSFFGDIDFFNQVALRGEMVSAEELARLAGNQNVKKMSVFMMDGSEQPVVLGFDGSNLVRLENIKSTLPSHRLTPIVVNAWGDSSKAISTKYVSTIKVALYERIAGNIWDVRVGTMKSDVISKLLSLTDEDGIRKSDDSTLSKCLLRLKLGSNNRSNPKRTKFLYDSIDCASLANVLFGNNLHLIEVDRSKSVGEIRALTESEMIGPSKISSVDTIRMLFEFNELETKTVDISSEGENTTNPWGYITSILSGKVQNWLHRSVVEGTPIVDFEGVDNITERIKYAKHQHIVQETDLSINSRGPDETQSRSVFAYVSLANKRLFHNIQNGNSLTEILWKTTGYLRSVYFGVPVRVGHARILDLLESENMSLRRKIKNIQIQTGDVKYREASMLEVVDHKGNSVLQMTEIGQKRGFIFLSIDSSKYGSIPSGWNLNNEILDTQFWLRDLSTIEEWMDDSAEFATLRKKLAYLTRIKDECYNLDLSKPLDVEEQKQEASRILTSILNQIDEFAIKKGLSPSDVIDSRKFADAICETVLLTKNTITTEPERASLSLPYHLDTNGMPIKVPNSLCPVSAEHLTAFFASLGSYSRYYPLLNKIERNSLTDFRQSFAVDARPANGGSDVVILSVGTEGGERMYETENKTYRYTDFQDRYVTRKRMLMRILESSGWDTKYHTINFVDAQKGFDKEQVSYMLEPGLSHSLGLERDEYLLAGYMKSSLRVFYDILSRIKQVAEILNDAFTIEELSPRLKKMRTLFRVQFGEELTWKGEKSSREKSIDWSALAGVSIDQSLLRLSGKRLFKGTHFAILQNSLSPLTSEFLSALGWIEPK